MDNLEKIINIIYSDIKIINSDINNSNLNINELDLVLLKIDTYDKQIKQILNIVNLINNLKNDIKIIYNHKLLNIKNELQNNNEKQIDSKLKIELKNITNVSKFNNKLYAKCPVISISESQIPLIINCPIYYINETKEYCIKINNKLIKGNISNIFSNENKNKSKIKKCTKIYCNNTHYDKKECNFYHENIDKRNFPNYSWSHIQKNKLGKIKTKKNTITYNKYDYENTRFLGSLDTLHEDLIFTNYNEKELRNKQLMHDLLLYQLLDQYLE